MSIEIRCAYDKLVKLDDLIDNPRNPNKHSKEQIERLSKLFDYHGVRIPIIVSKRSGLIVSGHGRKQAAKLAGMNEFPVSFQEFDDSDHEMSFMISDNAIADWSELDLADINMEIQDMGPFDLDMLGIDGFKVDPSELERDKREKPKEDKKCPHCGESVNG